LDVLLPPLALTGEDSYELAQMHEEVQISLARGELEAGRKRAEELVRRAPHFVSVLNNLSNIHFAEGDLAKAISTCRRALEQDPDNFHALSNLARFLLISGQTEEATEKAEQLKTVQSESPDLWVKQAEALSALGDDQGVLDVFTDAEQEGYLDTPLVNPFLYHLAGVAALRLGDEPSARRHWKRALELMPGQEITRQNLDDLRKPVGERHAPWPFPFNNWLPKRTLEALMQSVDRAAASPRNTALSRAMNRFLRQQPEVKALLPILLDRGDPQGREFAMHLASWAQSPEIAVVLKDFALGQRGPDQLRLQASQVASEEGGLPSGLTRFWIEGEWRELLLVGFEIHGEPIYRHNRKVEQILGEAFDALRQGEGEYGERLLRKAREIEPDKPDIVHNLAKAYELQGRADDALALVLENLEAHPKYVHGRIGLAQYYVTQGKLDEADALLTELLQEKRFHFSEFSSFCRAWIELLLAREQPEGARSWLQIWEQASPEDPNLPLLRRRVRSAMRNA
ncbi:MAG: tetratricopeptide repeat protein, partial [Ardenticatenaceae bacterium]